MNQLLSILFFHNRSFRKVYATKIIDNHFPKKSQINSLKTAVKIILLKIKISITEKNN